MITSETVNYLVWKYLQEEGLQLAAAALDQETDASKWDRGDSSVGELVKLLLKGQQLTDIEETVAKKHHVGASLPPDITKDRFSGVIKLDDEVEGGVSSVSTVSSLFLAGLSQALYFNPQTSTKYALDTGNDAPTVVENVPNAIVPQGLVGYVSGAVRLWQIGETEPVLQAVLLPESATAPVLLLEASNSGTMVCCVDIRGTVRVWDLQSRTLCCEQRMDEPIEAAVWLGGDASVGLAHSTGISVLPVSGSSGSDPVVLKFPKACITVFDEISQTLVAGSQTGMLSIFRLDQTNTTLKAHSGPISGLKYMGNKLLSTGVDGRIVLWEINSDPPNKLSELDTGEPVLAMEATTSFVALVKPSCVRILNPHTLDVVGEIQAKGVQCIAWLDHVLAVTTRNQTEMFRML